jgi:hypothetical protein
LFTLTQQNFKREPPLLVIFEEGYTILSPELINMWAEISNPDDEPHLFVIVKTCMIHELHGNAKVNAPCMENGNHIKKFPTEFQSETLGNVNSYSLYRTKEPG